MKKFSGALIAIVSFYFLVSCTETVSPVLTGSISGFVRLYYEEGSIVSDKSGVKVYIEGRNNFTYTNPEGRYILENVEAGIFNVVFEKEGFGLYKIIAKEFVGGGNGYIQEIQLNGLPSFNVTSLNISKTTEVPPRLILEGNVAISVGYSRNIILFFGKNESVSNEPQYYLTVGSAFIYPDSSSFKGTLWDYKKLFRESGFNKGETIYVAAYSVSSYYGFFDPNTGRYFCYNVGSSPVKSSFVLD